MISVDRWREAELRDHLEAISFPMAALAVRGQGFKDGGEDVRAFRKAILEGRVTPKKSLLFRSAMSEARVVTDSGGEREADEENARRPPGGCAGRPGGGCDPGRSRGNAPDVVPLHLKPSQDPYDLAGLQTLCRGCHLAKTSRENQRDDPARDAWLRLVDELS